MSSLEDRMGPRWSEAEVHLFFDGLRRFGKNWFQISSTFIQNSNSCIFPRSESMIESVYVKNKTYLGIPSANPTDFAAIMADHYDSCESINELNCDYLPGKAIDSVENVEIPKKRPERPMEVKTCLKKNFCKKIDAFDLVGKTVNSSFVTGKVQDCLNTRIFPEFTHCSSLFLVDYATSKVDEFQVSPKFLQWCKAEWFYSYIDKGFFTYNEFEEILKSLKFAEIEDLTKSEFQIIKSALGRPRRFSKSFISQERKKLSRYREAIKVLQQVKVLPSIYHDLLSYIKLNQTTSKSRLMVGQRVLAIHPLNREVRSGAILTLDSSRYHIQFDRPELGVFLVPDHNILPCSPDNIKIEVDETSSFIYKPVQEREVISSNFVIEGFKAGVNIYAMAFLLELLDRKETLIELLKQYNSEFAQKGQENRAWRPDYDQQQQYAWICVTVQAINTSISKVLEIFRLRNRPPPQPASRLEPDHKIEQIKDAANSIVLEELDQRTSQFSDNEFIRIQESLKNGVVLLGVVDLIIKENDPGLIRYLEENLNLLSPACESNKVKYEEVCKYIDQIKSRITNR